MPGNLTNALTFLVETLFNLYLTALMLRILLEAVHADYHNPVSQVLLRVTEPLVAPVRRLLPNLGRISLAGILVLLVLQLIALLLVLALAGQPFAWQTVLLATLMRPVRMLLILYLVLIIIGVVLSWLGGPARHPIVPLIWQLTEPVLRPIRRVLPAMGGLDLSPLVAIIAINFFLILILPWTR